MESKFLECPEPWIRWNDKCYKTDDLRTTLKERIEICTSLNSYVLMIDSDEENEFIEQQFTGRYWLGAMRDLGTKMFLKLKKGEAVWFTKWRKGEPNNYQGIENCIVFDHGKWNDLNCYMKSKGICEKSSQS
ncbi:C-type lectin domain family 4 member G-like protein [Leptotrombidium deliense]|uniref:C-type lectin domain family 4 member G-like protein n=1 Tax=Leptotrombidium deliense TaxID=299467 RepID=A0A443RYM1_9ACAR|nr:C-type lectin domain family 4 member G-like protein [Leptotrombidium deliense]